MKMASLCILIPPAVVLLGAAIAVSVKDGGTSQIQDTNNPHGFSEVLYWASSTGNNNGSAFAGLGTNNKLYNIAGGALMWFSRYWLMIPVLAIAGSLASKKHIPASTGTLPTHTPLFVTLLVGAVIVVGALSFIPALALGPIVEHLMMLAK
jgi:K+-transporting ATPase ATPase A chain